jgi:hypothetical protein
MSPKDYQHIRDNRLGINSETYRGKRGYFPTPKRIVSNDFDFFDSTLDKKAKKV